MTQKPRNRAECRNKESSVSGTSRRVKLPGKPRPALARRERVIILPKPRPVISRPSLIEPSQGAKTGPPFDVILADPPWNFRTYSAKGKGRSPSYPTMPLAELQALPVGELASPNAALFLWCCWPSIFRDVPGLLAAWGFEYRACAFMWCKANPRGAGFFSGLGYYTRANTEPCLIAVRGSMPVAAHNVAQVIYSPVRRHSQKPEEQYSRIEKLYPGARYLELFAREKRPGWAAWGNEIESDIAMPGAERSPAKT